MIWNMTTTIDTDNVLRWYTGKARAAMADFALPTLATARELGYWPAGTSRKVRAALNKQAVASKLGRKHQDELRDLENTEAGAPWQIAHALTFASLARVQSVAEIAAALVARGGLSPAVAEVVRQAADWAADFAPVAELVAILDSRRPAPVVVLGSLSPAVAANLGGTLGIRFESLRSPEVVARWIEVEIKGEKRQVQEIEIVWPEGTQHLRSRFAHGSRAGNEQCHACGHAIRDPYNWVPLVADGPDGPMSLWVGRDCARKMFRAEVTGDAVYKR